MVRTKLIAITLLLIAITGCSSSLSKEECLNADWYIIGLEDGSSGFPLASIGRHREACAKINVSPDISQYEAGLNKGYESYCTRASGYTVGTSGRKYHGVCSDEAGRIFNKAFNDGRNLYDLRLQQGRIHHQMDAERDGIAESLETIAEYEDQIVLAETTAEERRELLDSIKKLQTYIVEANASLDILYVEHEKLQYAVEDLEKYHQSLGYQ